ncbi:TonB-dependent siderophore receptor [Pseudoroseomonas ludipueritiae]|uniref:TonB-dependent siderophore receptor n=1 Tax=Pseudoroseomonas ludipueritiae TaxID=198093 RepID=A0ABR7RB41_9PROT|nr:TonB-dependent siderophore receptor [Pseudoroseomonas ludipueritiae]MBC9179049.1 TonB-dependent siderophore receptor [Pseudoroseomonas ludipueritiae]
MAPRGRDLALATTALSSLLLALPASAQESTAAPLTLPEETPAGTLVLPEVNVQATAWRAWQPVEGYVAPLTTTGTKTDTPLIETPQSVGIVTRDQIDDQGALNVSQALRYTAGVLPEVRPTSRYDSVFVRGFGGQGTSAAYVNFLDGLRQQRGISYAIPTVDPWLLERIEVLRGPASVLYGQTGSGGIVNLVSRRPTEEAVHEVRLEAGSHSLLQTAFDFGGKLTEDGQFLYRLTGIGRIAETQYDYNKESRIAVAPAITWRPTADTTLTVLGNYQYEPDGGFYNFAPAVGTVLPNRFGRRLPSSFFSGDPNYNLFQRRLASIGYQLEHRFDETWTFRQNFRYQHIDAEFKAISGRALATNQRTLSRSIVHSIEHADTFALDNQAQATFSTGPMDHTMLFGIDWGRSSAKRRLGNAGLSPAYALDIFSPSYGLDFPEPTLATTTQIQDQLGFYAQDQIALGKLRLTLGLRQDFATSETVTRATGRSASQEDSAFTWRVGALYLFDNGLAPYASYATSFLPNSGTYSPARGGAPFDPTTGEQYEAGIKFQPNGFNSYIQLAAFQIRQQDVLTPDPAATTYSIQTGEIRSRGIELEGRASLNDNLDLIAAYAYTDAEVTESTTAGVTGKAVPQVPKHSASAWADYRFTDGPLRGLGLGAGVRYIGKTPGDETNSFHVSSFTLFDAAIRYDLGALREDLKGAQLTLNVSNIGDKDYVASCSSADACYFGNRRLVLAGLRYKW